MNQTDLEQGYDVHRFGHEREPVIVIDGFSGWTDGLIKAGRSAQYEQVTGYPGIRANIEPKGYVSQADKAPLLAAALRDEFGFSQMKFESCSFSIVTLRPEELSPAQRIPHFDEARAHVVAIVHYLSARAESGTAFYRHRRTGFETITPERLDDYERAKKTDDADFGEAAAQYQRGDSERYELIGEVEAKPDRLIAYRGRQLHSGNILSVPAPDRAVTEGRLTVTGFILGA